MLEQKWLNIILYLLLSIIITIIIIRSIFLYFNLFFK